MQAKVFYALSHKAFVSLGKLLARHAVFGVARVIHNVVGNGKMPARVVAAAHGIGNISHALQKVNMGNIIQIYSGIKFTCQLKIFGRRIVGRKHNFVTLKANRISH